MHKQGADCTGQAGTLTGTPRWHARLANQLLYNCTTQQAHQVCSLQSHLSPQGIWQCGKWTGIQSPGPLPFSVTTCLISPVPLREEPSEIRFSKAEQPACSLEPLLSLTHPSSSLEPISVLAALGKDSSVIIYKLDAVTAAPLETHLKATVVVLGRIMVTLNVCGWVCAVPWNI